MTATTAAPYRVVVHLPGTGTTRPAVYREAATAGDARELAATYAATISNRITLERRLGAGWVEVEDAGPMISCGYCDGPVCAVCGRVD